MNLKSFFCKKFLFLFLCCFCSFYAFTKDKVTIVTINSADTSDFKKNDETDEDEIILSGNVSIIIEKDKSKLEITADKINFNRAAQILYATGNVTVVQYKDGSKNQSTTAATVLLNTSSLEGVFDNGRSVQVESDAMNLPSGSTMIVASRIFGRDSSGTIAFKNAELTFCDDKDPHWKIKATRIWLLPGGEFAFLNARVHVGKIPVLYLPAFYYPKDELLFNPSFGYDERFGYYFQTTTYLFGRKPLNDSTTSSDSDESLGEGIMNFMAPSTLKKQKREGLVLHNLDENYTGDTSNYFKIMADYYANMGLTAGFAGVYNPLSSEYISSIEGSVQLGFTNTVFYKNGKYLSYSSEGKTERDKANLLGFETPFRYGIEFETEIKKPFTLNVSLPIYSDPYWTEDFETRSEYLNWISFLLSETSAADEEDTEDTSSQISSFEWTANASYNLPIPYLVQPFISTIAITELSANVSFDSKSRTDSDFLAADSDWQYYTPERSFFYPTQTVPFKIALKFEGTLFEYPFQNYYKPYDAPSFPIDLNMPDELKTDKQREDEKVKEEGNDEKKEPKEETDEITFVNRELEPSFNNSITDVEGITYKLTYSILPQLTTQVNYDSSDLEQASDFKWSNVYSNYYQLKAPTTLTSNFTYRDTFINSKNDLVFNPVYQDHPNLNGYTTESSKNSVKLSDYSARKMDLTNNNIFSFKPFVYSSVFKDSGFEWNSTIRVVKTEFLGDEKNPEWRYAIADLGDEDYVTTHTVSAILSAKESDEMSQKITLTSNIKPQLDKYSLNTTFDFPHLTLAAECAIEQESEDSDNYEWEPFKQSATLKFFDGDLTFTESFNYDMEEEHSDSLKLALAWKNLQLSYTMQYTTDYDFDENYGWVAKEDKKFMPYTINLAYGTTEKKFKYWRNRITWTPTLTTGLVYDCVRPTNSYFRFVPGVVFRIHDAFDLSFSAETQNDVIFRYFQKYTKYKDILAGEDNMFKDLWNSFAFWGDDSFYDSNQTKRRSSGFKLKSLNISITRNLHDWNMIGTLAFKPRAITDSDGTKIYDYHPYITFAISWHPMPSFRTKLVDEYGEWNLE